MALVPLPDRPSSLPAPLTSLVGRTRERAEVAALLLRPEVRLVTLTGPGGVGKTRLALTVAADLAEERDREVAFIELATVREQERVLPAIALALGVRDGNAPTGSASTAARLAAALQGRRFVLILDNLEQVLDAALHLADFLKACPDLTLLVTSRAPMRISGEHVFPVPPLSLRRGDPSRAGFGTEGRGGEGDVPTVSPSLRLPVWSEAVQLFVERARAADPAFDLTEANSASVVTICERLDGLPLAIELAAARIPVLSPRALAARLTDRLRLLTGGALDQPPRLQSMRDAISWSYDLLSSQEKALVRCLGCFVGGCTLEAAEAVCGEVGLDVLDGVQALVRQSLLRRVDQPGETPRYGMLETIREAALEWLESCGETETTRARHAAYFVELAGRPKLTWWVVEETLGEGANLRAALTWAIDRKASEFVLPLAIAVWQLLEPGADYEALERAVEATTEVPAALQGKRVLLLAATAPYAMWRSDADRAAALLEECLALAGDTDQSADIALAMLSLGIIATGRGDLDQAEALAEEARRRWQALGETGWVGEVLGMLGGIAQLRGERNRSEALLEESVTIARVAGPAPALALALGCLGACVLGRGDHRRAAALLAESIELARRGRDPVIVKTSIEQLATLASAAGRAEQAIRLLAVCTAWKEHFGFDPVPTDRSWLDSAMATARARLEETEFAAAWEAGWALSLEQAATEALALAEAIRDEPESGDPAATVVDPAAEYGLTSRERDVLELLAKGRSNREIAEELFMAGRTVQTHLTHIYAKLGVSSRAAAIAFSHEHDLC